MGLLDLLYFMLRMYMAYDSPWHQIIMSVGARAGVSSVWQHVKIGTMLTCDLLGVIIQLQFLRY